MWIYIIIALTNAFIGFFLANREEDKVKGIRKLAIFKWVPKHNVTPIYTLRQTNTSSRIYTTI